MSKPEDGAQARPPKRTKAKASKPDTNPSTAPAPLSKTGNASPTWAEILRRQSELELRLREDSKRITHESERFRREMDRIEELQRKEMAQITEFQRQAMERQRLRHQLAPTDQAPPDQDKLIADLWREVEDLKVSLKKTKAQRLLDSETPGPWCTVIWDCYVDDIPVSKLDRVYSN